MNDLAKNVILWIVIAIVLLSVFNNFATGPRMEQTIQYSQFLDYVETGMIDNVVFQGRDITGELKAGGAFKTFSPETDNTAVIGLLQKKGVTFSGKEAEGQNLLVSLLINAFPVLLLIGVWIYFMRQMQGGGGGRGALSFGKSRARLLGEDQVNVTFADVAGVGGGQRRTSGSSRLPDGPGQVPAPGWQNSQRRLVGWFTGYR